MNVNRMRQCFLVAAEWHGWSEQDQAEFGAEIKAAIEGENEVALAWWEAYLEEASSLTQLNSLCRAAEQRIRVAAAERMAA